MNLLLKHSVAARAWIVSLGTRGKVALAASSTLLVAGACGWRCSRREHLRWRWVLISTPKTSTRPPVRLLRRALTHASSRGG